MVNTGDSGGGYNRLVRLMRLPRLYRMVRILRLFKFMKVVKNIKSLNYIFSKIRLNSAMTRLIAMIFVALFLVHLMACFWFLAAKFEDFSPDTWVARFELQDADHSTQYMHSLYWCFQTLTTVGFGDYPAVTYMERILSLFWMGLGVVFYSFVIGNFSSMIENNDIMKHQLNVKLKAIAEFTKQTGLPLDIYIKIKRFIENNFYYLFSDDEEDKLIKELPPSMRDEVMNFIHGEIKNSIHFLRECDDQDFLFNLLPLLKYMNYDKGDSIYSLGDHAPQLFFIKRGEVLL